MSASGWLDRLLDHVVAVLSAPFDFLQRRLGRDDDDDNPHDPTLWL